MEGTEIPSVLFTVFATLCTYRQLMYEVLKRSCDNLLFLSGPLGRIELADLVSLDK